MSRSNNAEGRIARLFRRHHDDLLERSIRACPGCAADVHVFADVCRHCGVALELLAS
ncbi:MAG TPA: hypothetical protein VGP03_04135 [Pseudonocardiaceae bacterium]|nr:hypothetical protein [Pseudonocardiaceae bacterium]